MILLDTNVVIAFFYGRINNEYKNQKNLSSRNRYLGQLCSHLSQDTFNHLSSWKNVIKKTYGRKTYYLMAVNSSKFKGRAINWL